jgi:TolB-like protein/Flp pilus assembly protein TadD
MRVAIHLIQHCLLCGLLAALLACSAEQPAPALANLASETESDAAPQPAAPVAPVEKSVAVLPFADLSEFGDQQYFSDGLSEYLIDTLSMIPDLHVAMRDASFYYKGRNVVLSEVGETLGVTHILQGSVRKAGNRLRVSAQLVSAETGFNLWSSTFDRDLVDVFAIQEEIARAVTTSLSITLGAGRFDIPGMTRDIAAYDKALQAVATYNQFTPDTVFLALDLLHEVVRIDPQYGRAWVLLGSIYTDSQLILSAEEAARFSRLAEQAYAHARQVAPGMPELQLVEARRQRDAGNYGDAESIYREYFELSRNVSARSLEEYAQLLSTTGRLEAAIALLERAKSQEPFEPRYSFQLAMHLLYADRVDAALAEAEYGKTLEGSQWLMHSIGWQAALKRGQRERAAELIGAYYDEYGDTGSAAVSRRFMGEFSTMLLANDFQTSANTVVALIHSPAVTPVELVYLARLAAQLGQPEVALDYWYGQPIGPAIWDSFYSEMRKLPEFQALMQDKGLWDYWQSSGQWPDSCQPQDAMLLCN